MRLLTLDFETNDPNLKLYGQGWVFGYHYPEYNFNVLLAAYRTHDGKIGYTDDWDALQGLLDAHDGIIGHNLMYDIGCLLFLHQQRLIRFTLFDKMLYDTMILAKLYNQNFNRYSLDYLGGVLCSTNKKSSLLHDWAWSTGLYAQKRKEITGRNCKTRPSEAVLEQWCKTNMQLFPSNVLGDYAVGDVELTQTLYTRLIERVDYLDLKRYSDLLYITIDMKLRGVAIDLKQCDHVMVEFTQIENNATNEIYKSVGHEFSIGKIQKELAPELCRLGYDVSTTDKGNYSVTDEWLEDQSTELCNNIRLYRQALQKKRNFIGKIIKYQQAIPEQYRDNVRGMLYPTLKLLGAHVTGRFSSGGGSGSLEVSIHQIPVRDEVFGKPCRSIFIPYAGETWIAGDFNSQESRLQVHDACLLQCDRAEEIRQQWIDDPNMSYHDATAKMIGIDRGHAKTINLALSYGLGRNKLVKRLGVDVDEGNKIIDQYHKLLPFMQQLQLKCQHALKTNRYIKTIDGRKLVISKKGPGSPNPDKDGLSRRVQGSAAGQCMSAMIKCYEAGLKILIVVHDEINISSANPDVDRDTLKRCMEEAMQLLVPVVAEVNIGGSWLEAK